MTGHVYLMEAGSTVIPGGLVLAPAGNGHFHLAPLHDMPLARFVELLRILSGSCVYAGRIEDLPVEA